MEENLMLMIEETDTDDTAEEITLAEEADGGFDDCPVPDEEVADVSETEATEDNTETLEELRAEVGRLRSALEDKHRENERVLTEIAEFTELFPKRGLENVPEEVWDKVKGGIPLAAAYALYEKKAEARAAFAEEVNRKNAERSSGAVGRDTGSAYFSPSEVKKMSAAEVKKNYSIIIESMKKWN